LNFRKTIRERFPAADRNVMAIVPDARPQDADRGQIEFLLNCSGCDWIPPQILAVELKQVERAMSRAGGRAVASD
jgi:hypothetical protein